jgi:hypothetical protein
MNKVESRTALLIDQPTKSTLWKDQLHQGVSLNSKPTLGDSSRHQYPSLYQINTRVWLRDLSDALRANRSQCYLPIPFDEVRGYTICLQDLLSPAAYQRDGDGLRSRGLYLDTPPWGYQVFRLVPLNST